jgi:myo-inositol-1(or 4)-monophosphatase
MNSIPKIESELQNRLEEICKKVCLLTEEVSEFLSTENKKFSKDSIVYKGFNDLVSFVDKEAEKLIVTGCKAILPEAGFLTEEGTVEPGNADSTDLLWIIDPLDGTTNFVHKVPIFSISIGLVLKGTPILGVVVHVPNKETYYAWNGGGAWCNGEKISVSPVSKLSESLLATGFPYFEFDKIHAYLNIIHDLMRKTHGLRRMGSAAIDLVYVACGIFEGFFEYNLSPWDVAAGICIIREAGGTVSDFDGNDNAVYGRQIVAAGPVHSEFLGEIQAKWDKELLP